MKQKSYWKEQEETLNVLKIHSNNSGDLRIYQNLRNSNDPV